MKIGIVGAGAMGQLFGARMDLAGQKVVLIDIDESIVEKIDQDGVTLQWAGAEYNARPTARLANQAVGALDLIIFFTKSYHTRSAAESIHHLISDDTLVLSLQNGLGNDCALGGMVDSERILLGVTTFSADRTAPGMISSSGQGFVILGSASGVPEGHRAADQIAAMLTSAKLKASSDEQVLVPIWEKLIFNAVLNTVTAATGLTVGGIQSRPPAKQLAKSVLEESLAVASELGVAIDSSRVQSQIKAAYTEHASHKTSMLIDVEHGRPTEIDAIGGAIAREGQMLNIQTPILTTLCNVIRSRNASC